MRKKKKKEILDRLTKKEDGETYISEKEQRERERKREREKV